MWGFLEAVIIKVLLLLIVGLWRYFFIWAYGFSCSDIVVDSAHKSIITSTVLLCHPREAGTRVFFALFFFSKQIFFFRDISCVGVSIKEQYVLPLFFLCHVPKVV